MTSAIYPRHVCVNSRFIRPFIDLTIYGWPWKILITYFNIVCTTIIFHQQSFIFIDESDLAQCSLINVPNINWFLNQLEILEFSLWNCNKFQIQKSLWDHPFKTSACLREEGVSPYADGLKVIVHKGKNLLQEHFAGMPIVGG